MYQFHFSWYSYILLTSSLFLLVTIAIYSYYSQLLNEYTRIMRHFAIALYVAFTFLAITNLGYGVIGDYFCRISGKKPIWVPIIIKNKIWNTYKPSTEKWFLLGKIIFRFLDSILFLGGIYIDDYHEHWNVVQNYVSVKCYNDHLQM